LHAGCQTISRFQALALARSRHYQWFEHGQWNYDVTSDYGRIYRQDEFIKAFINKAKQLWNPLTINNLLSNLPQGISLDSNFTLNDLIALAWKFHGINANAMTYYTLPTIGSQTSSPLGDVLYVNEPEAEQTLVKIFGSQLLRPTNPPPNTAGQPAMPPVITVPKPVTSSSSATGTSKPVHHPVTTTTVEGDQYFNPVPC
jgi:anionic cell wall polymer biosynthesis LytR-Cps2A-Psr (LCP) family protein